MPGTVPEPVEVRFTHGKMSLTMLRFKSGRPHRYGFVAAAVLGVSILGGCQSVQVGQVLNQGYVIDEQTLALAPVGSSREQVLLSLGTPSATATFDTEVFYYISQQRKRTIAFMKPSLVSQTVLAVYMDKDGNVARLANYQMQDGRVFDMISRTTPTGGVELTFIQRLLRGGPSASAVRDSVFNRNRPPGQ